MDEFAITHVDAYMAKCAAHGVEEYQVAWLEVFFGNSLCCCCLLNGTAWQHAANGLLESGAYEAAAIKTCFGRVAAVAVTHAQKFHGVAYQIRCVVADVLACALELREHGVVLDEEFFQLVRLGGCAGTRGG